MSQVEVKFKRVVEDAIIPKRQHPTDTGMDLYANEEVTLAPGEYRAVSTGIAMEVIGLYDDVDSIDIDIQVRPRSGLAAKYGITVLNTPGTIDVSYRGEIKVILINLGRDSYTIKKGDRIAQVVFGVFIRPDVKIVKKLSDTDRGSNGFGSTGK